MFAFISVDWEKDKVLSLRLRVQDERHNICVLTTVSPQKNDKRL